jgi:small-conductance mechanosensitive channel
MNFKRLMVLFFREYGPRMLQSLYTVVAIIVIYFLVRLLLFSLIDRLTLISLTHVASSASESRKSRLLAMRSAMKSVAGLVLTLIAFIMVLQAVGLNVVPLITTAGIAGLAVGFGAQKLVRDVIAGFFMLLEDHYGVGDYVTVGSVTGLVEELGMRATRLRDSAGRLHIIANGDIAQVCNHSRGAFRANFDLPVAGSIDLDKIRDVLNAVGEALHREYPETVRDNIVCDGLSQYGAAFVTVRMSGSVDPRKHEDVRILLNTRAHAALLSAGIPTG